jgi:penicillin-binding protein 1A
MARSSKDRIEPRFDAKGGREPVAGRKRGSRARKEKPARRRGLFGRMIYWGFVLGVWGVIGLGALIGWFALQMPSAASWSIPDRAPNIKILAADGALIANRGLTGGEALSLGEMSPFIPKAVIAIEDRRFMSHFGVDPIGLARAMLANVMAGRLVQGGSTLTQQLAKNLFLEPSRTLERKVQEALLAFWIEHKYTKDQILELYLNRVFFGSNAYGVEAASRRYFDKSAREVTLQEAALLAGLLKAPSRLSPARDPEAANARAALVLNAMRETGAITDDDLKVALSAETIRAASYWTGAENYVADRVMDDIRSLVGEVTRDLVVTTTVDLRLQRAAETAIRKAVVQNGEARKVSQGALVAVDSTGAVRALVGGMDYSKSQFDRASAARRQPGSAFKPFVFLAALEAGYSSQSVIDDHPVRFGKWAPENYKDKYYGPVTLTTALSKSLNSVAAQLAMQVGPERVRETAMRLGIASPLEANGALSLGTSEVTPLELTAAYAAFANGGLQAPPRLIDVVTDNDGTVVYEAGNVGSARVINRDIAAEMNRMMSVTVTDGTARKAAFDWPSAGKTGTSQNARDAWFIGYTSHMTAGVWFGNDDGDPMRDVTGGSLAATAWRDFMVAAHRGLAPQPLVGADQARPTTILDIIAGELGAGELGSGEFAARPDTDGLAPLGTDGTPTGAAPPRQTTILDIIMGG